MTFLCLWGVFGQGQVYMHSPLGVIWHRHTSLHFSLLPLSPPSHPPHPLTYCDSHSTCTLKCEKTNPYMHMHDFHKHLPQKHAWCKRESQITYSLTIFPRRAYFSIHVHVHVASQVRMYLVVLWSLYMYICTMWLVQSLVVCEGTRTCSSDS